VKIYNISTSYTNSLLLEKIDGGRVLDVGGSEYPMRANLIAENVKGSEVTMLDMTEPRQILSEKLSFIKMPLEDASPSVLGTFRHILLSNVLEHLVSPANGLKVCAGILEDGGCVHILSPNCESLNRRIGLIMGEMSSIRDISPNEVAMGHLHALNVQDVLDAISDAGLVIEEYFGVLLKPLPTPEMITWPEKRIDAFFKIAPSVSSELCHEVYFRARKPAKRP